MGVPVKDCVKLVMQAPERAGFQAMLFSKIVPNCKKLGLLDPRTPWLRERFTEMGVLDYEDFVDTSVEYTELNAIEQERAAAAVAGR